MGQADLFDILEEPDLESINAVTIASCAIQQLPKLLHAMNNMAKRSRRQLLRKGVVLGGHGSEKEEVPRRKGILKKDNELSLDQLCAYNEFWKIYNFSFQHDEKPINCSSAHHFSCKNSCWRFSRRTTPKSFYCLHENQDCQSPTFAVGQLCAQNLQGSLYKSQTLIFMESFPSHLTSLESLKSILFRHLSRLELTCEEQEILFQLQYLKILFNTPLHKLVRERPKEYLLPLPRRHPRHPAAVASKPYYARSLTTHQTVLTLPNPHQTFKWLSLTNLTFGRSSIFGFGNNEFEESMRLKRSSTTTIPKGVAFITYPDSVDETSFEGTIGGRNMISWEKGTKFPQMGIDQSTEFKYKKEMGKQQMIQSRLRAARIYRRIYCDHWNNYVNGNKQGILRTCQNPPKKKGVKRNKTCQVKSAGVETPANSLLKSWFKLAQLKQSLRVISESLRNSRSDSNLSLSADTSATTTPTDAGGNVINQRDILRAAKYAERKRRIKMCLITIAKYLTCGLLPYFMKGECRIVKRKQLRTSDSTERCPTPPLPSVETILAGTSVTAKERKCEILPT